MAPTRKFSQATAYHEAGHAIVAWALGLRVGTVHVREEDAGGGADTGPADHLNLVDQIAVCSAGYAAEQVFGIENHDLASFTDHARIADLLAANGVSEEDRGAALRDEAHHRARALLEQYKQKVIRLAQRLVTTGSVSESEFLRFIGDC
jgi:ATP-dependent Zn protease